MTILNRLKEVIKNKSLKLKDISQAIDIPTSSISNYVNQKRDLSLNFIVKFSYEYKINADWLLHGIGEMNNNNPQMRIPDVTEVPFFTDVKASAGYGFSNYHENNSTIRIDTKILEPYNIQNLVVIKATGDSMAPKINHDDYLILDYKKQDVFQDGKIYIVRVNETLLVKILVKTLDGFNLISYNKEYTPQPIPLQAFKDGRAEIIGKVILNISNI